ncbi:hypothetical protein OAU52_00380 [bacterium]|nr:hypothetical protein [bacterium]
MKKIMIMALLAFVVSLVWLSVVSSMRENVMVGFDQVFATSWGVATIVDLYAGLFVMAMIAVITEKKKWMKLIWIPIILFLGNFGSLIFMIRILVGLPANKWKDAFRLVGAKNE